MKTTEIKVITPEEAAEMLKKNAHNRTPSQKHIAILAEDMRAGRFWFNGAAIVFDSEGNLVDGQHRLMACVRAGVPIEVTVVRGIAPEAADDIDTGKCRSAGNALSRKEIPDPNNTAAIIRQFKMLSAKRIGRTASDTQSTFITNRGIVEEYQANAEIYEWAKKIGREAYTSTGRALTPKLVGGVSVYLLRALGHTRESIESFWQKVEKDPGTTACGILRERFFKSLVTYDFKARIPDEAKMLFVIKAWNYHASGRSPKQLSLDPRFDTNAWFK